MPTPGPQHLAFAINLTATTAIQHIVTLAEIVVEVGNLSHTNTALLQKAVTLANIIAKAGKLLSELGLIPGSHP
jgi:hypothetical protein